MGYFADRIHSDGRVIVFLAGENIHDRKIKIFQPCRVEIIIIEGCKDAVRSITLRKFNRYADVWMDEIPKIAMMPDSTNFEDTLYGFQQE